MHNRFLVFIFVACLWMRFACQADGQSDPAVGIPPNAARLTIPLGFVDTLSGQVHLEIPIESIPQRGGRPFGLKAVYDSTYYSPAGCGTGCFQPQNGSNWNVGESLPGTGYAIVDVQSNYRKCPSPYTVGSVSRYYNFRVRDSDGTIHPFNSTNFYDLHYVCYYVTQGVVHYRTPADEYFGGPAFTNDGQGIYLDAQRDVWFPDGWHLPAPGTGQAYDTNGNTGGQFSQYPVTFSSNAGNCGSANPYYYYVKASDGSTQTYTFTCQAYTVGLSGYTPGTVYMLSAITLPDTSQYTFTYAAQTGILTDVSLPTGGHVSFTYALDTYNAPQLTSVTFGGGTWNLTGVNLLSQNVAATTSLTAPPRFDVNTNSYLQDRTVYTPTPWGANSPRFPQTIQYYSGSNTLLRTESMTYSNFCLGSKTTTLNDTGQSSKVTFSYGSPVICSQPTQKQEWDYGSTTPTRTTNITYIQDTPTISYNSQYHIYNRPTSVLVYAGDGTTGSPVASTTYTYDEYSSNYCSVPGLTNITGAVNHDDAGHSAAFAARGNLTSITRLVSSGNYVTTHNCYDTLGNVTQTVDESGHPTNYDYTDNWADSACIAAGSITRAFASVVTDAMGFRHKTTRASCTALKTAVADENDLQNGRAGTTFTFDWKSRPLCVNYADGGQSCNAYFGAAQPAYSTQTTLINSTTSLNSETVFDGLGRVQQAQVTSDPDGTDYVDTAYDALGRTFSVSNPYRSTSDATYGLTKNYYDALGRTVSVVDQDGSTVPTTYLGNCSTSIDEAGKSRKACADGLGRLAQVFEDPAGLNYETDYGYDALDNLLTVTQKGGTTNSSLWRNRTFAYDGLSRLLSATNPESGTINYAYDPIGNLQSKTAPSPNQPQAGTATVTTSYTYDVLNRLTKKSYSDSYSPNFATPAVTYGYDGLSIPCTPGIGFVGGANVIGRRTSMCDASGSSSIKQFDAMGRVYMENQRLGLSGNLSQNTQYGWNLDGSPLGMYYPGDVGQDLEEIWNFTGAGRESGIQSAHSYYLWSVHYSPDGQITSATGNWQSNPRPVLTNTFNNRLQPVTISVATNTGTTIFGETYDFHSGNGDNGNVFAITNNKDNNRGQNFTYDALNRITAAYTNGPNWGETFTIDSWGNLTNRGPYTGKTQYEPLNAAPATVRNQLTGFTYDAAGNMMQDALHSYLYDAENRIMSVDGGATTYTYDGLGRRVRKCNGTSCASGTLYWRNVFGETVAESDVLGNFTATYINFHGQPIARLDIASGNRRQYFGDRLRSTNVETDQSGNIITESDYYPYGGEIPVGSGSDPNSHYKFTGKERDTESGLDMFGARYYGSRLGRFMTPDWSNIISPVPYASVDDPQTLNLYSYVRNNPTALYDPDGHCPDNNFAQFFCNLGQRIDNGVHGLGFHTDAQVEDIFHRDVLWIRTNTTQDVEKMSTKQVIDYYNGAQARKPYVDSGDTRFYLTYAAALAGVIPPKLYRGGTNMEGRPNIDLRIDKETGLVKPGYGISLNENPGGLEQFGGANEIDQSSVPPELEIKQVGRPGHYELTAREPMTVQRYNELAVQVKTK